MANERWSATGQGKKQPERIETSVTSKEAACNRAEQIYAGEQVYEPAGKKLGYHEDVQQDLL